MQIDLHYAIQLLVNTLLPRFSPEDRLLHVHVEATYAITTKSGRRRENYRDIHLLFHRPNNYTKVFWFTSSKPTQLRDIPADAWTLKCDHDSCWTTDGLSSPLFKISMELCGKSSPPEVSKFVRFGFTPIQWVTGTVKCTKDGFPRQYEVTVQGTKKIDEWVITEAKRQS